MFTQVWFWHEQWGFHREWQKCSTNILINLNTLASSQALAWKRSLLYNDQLRRAYG